mgnify:CR=1 FL=1
MIYFDNSATSPVSEEVLDAMLPYLKEEYGNPSSKYYSKSITASNAIEKSREQVARLLGVNPREIIFTAGATESTNFIIKGYMDYRRYYGDGKNHIITSSVEHKATLNTCKYLAGEIYSNDDPTTSLFGKNIKVDRGYEATFVEPTEYGEITKESIQNAIKDNSAMVSTIYVNNEVGTISDVGAIGKLCRDHDIAYHVDLTQAIGKMRIDVRSLNIDFASCSAHKIYGPKGVGAAILKSDAYGIEPISAFMHGGEQEFGVRGGTLAVHNIVGFGKAAEIAMRDLNEDLVRIKALDEKVIRGLLQIPELQLTNPMANRISGIISIIVRKRDFHNERYIKEIKDKLAISTGSACSAGEPSHVISAMGLNSDVTRILRVSIGKYTTEKDVEELIEIFKETI